MTTKRARRRAVRPPRAAAELVAADRAELVHLRDVRERLLDGMARAVMPPAPDPAAQRFAAAVRAGAKSDPWLAAAVGVPGERAAMDPQARARIAKAVCARVAADAAVERLPPGAGVRQRARLLRRYRDALLEWVATTRRADGQDVPGWVEMTAAGLVELARDPADAVEQRVVDRWLTGLVPALMGDEAARDRLRGQGAAGGRAGRGKAKQQHTELIWRAADFLATHSQSATPGRVRTLLKGRWQMLAYEMGDPLSDIVSVNVRGSVIDVEYTARWAQRRRRRSPFVEVDDAALKKALSRRPAAR